MGSACCGGGQAVNALACRPAVFEDAPFDAIGKGARVGGQVPDCADRVFTARSVASSYGRPAGQQTKKFDRITFV